MWAFLSRRISKWPVYVMGALIWMAALSALFFVPQNVVTPYHFIAFFVGIGTSVAYPIPWSMLPDVIEYDELQTGQRWEGIFF